MAGREEKAASAKTRKKTRLHCQSLAGLRWYDGSGDGRLYTIDASFTAFPHRIISGIIARGCNTIAQE